jgi:hypothetical protein
MRVVDERTRGGPTGEGDFRVNRSVTDSGNRRCRGGGAVAGPRREVQHVEVGSSRSVLAEGDFRPIQ